MYVTLRLPLIINICPTQTAALPKAIQWFREVVLPKHKPEDHDFSVAIGGELFPYQN